MTPNTLVAKIKLRDGNEIPAVGFGTYELDGQDAYNAVTYALDAGYRLIDSAAWYENEREVGQAILDFCKAKSIPRSDVFFTTKLKLNNGYDNVRAAIRRSVETCGLGYVDLYLVHGPLGGTEMRKQSWKAICDAKKEEGTLKSIGISTYGIKHIEEILAMQDVEIPVVHQIDLHPFMVRKDIVELSRKHGMLMEAWAPLVRSLRFDHPSIIKISTKYNKSPAQILLRYSLDKGYIPLPKSVSKHRISSNAQLFDFSLTKEEVEHLDSLDEHFVTDWEPTTCA